MRCIRHLWVLVPLAAAQPAAAANVTLNSNLLSSCTLTLSSAGVMAPSATGTVLSSEQSGGSPATLSLIAVGVTPTIDFAAPSLTTSPGGWSASHTDEQPQPRVTIFPSDNMLGGQSRRSIAPASTSSRSSG